MEEIKNDSFEVEAENIEMELNEEEKLRFRLQEADVELEKYEDILPEDMDDETYQKMKELEFEIKSIKKKLKETSTSTIQNSIWEKLNIGYVIWGILAFLMVVYPLGPLLSANYLTIVKSILTFIANNVSNTTLQKIFVFMIYLIYFVLFIVVDLIIYRFIKKNKINFWTMVTITSIHLLASIISVSIVIDSFF